MSGASFVPDPSWPSILELAKKLWGEPTAWSADKNEVRFGKNGSKSIKIREMVWQDHEPPGANGGYIAIYKLANNGALPPRKPKPGNGEGSKRKLWENVGTIYPYHDAAGDLVLDVVRTLDGNPRFVQRAPNGFLRDGSIKWRWSVKHIAGHDALLYRLPGLRASGDATVWICEGEKDTDRLTDELLIATCSIGGAGKWRDDYVEEFRDKAVVVLQDNDQAGRDHVATVARSLYGIATSVKVLLLPDLPPKGDVSDWLDAGGTIAELERLARNAREYTLPSTAGRILSGRDFIADHVPPVWLIDGIVQRSRLYACTSLTGHGKTAVWLFNACMIHAGRAIGHLDTFKGNVLILAGENPSDLKARMIGMVNEYDLPLGQLPYVLPGSFPMNEEEVDALKHDIAGLGVPLVLIIGDTASSFFPGDDENSNVEAGNYARNLRTFTEDCDGQPAVVVLCHPVKNARAKTDLLPRGGGAFLNELDANLTLWSVSQGEVTEMHWTGKIRGPDFSAIGYRLRTVPTGLIDEKDRPEITIVAEPMSEEAVADHSKQTLANEDAVLMAMRDHPDWSFAQIARHAGWLDDSDQPMKPRVQRAIANLARDKLVAQERHGAPWTITEKGRAALATDTQPTEAAAPEPTPTEAAAPQPPPPTEAEIAAEIERLAGMSDAAFLALDRQALAARLRCTLTELGAMRRGERAAKTRAEAAVAKAEQAKAATLANTSAARAKKAAGKPKGKVAAVVVAKAAKKAAKPRAKKPPDEAGQ